MIIKSVIDTMMGPWETAPAETVEEEELDIFAELGALRPTAAATQPQLHQHMPSQNQSSDPLAMFMEDDEDEPLLACQTAQPHVSQMEAIGTTAVSQQDDSGKPNFAAHVSNEVISELLEILVKKELHSRNERGEDWLSDLPAEAVAKIESAKVIKDQEAYHLSLIIDMVGTGQVRPFATVLSTEQGTLPVAPPPQIPTSWHPLYNALRELLLSAMNSLTALKVVSN